MHVQSNLPVLGIGTMFDLRVFYVSQRVRVGPVKIQGMFTISGCQSKNVALDADAGSRTTLIAG